MKSKPHESPSCSCKACVRWRARDPRSMLDAMQATLEQQAEEDERVFAVLDRIAREGFDPERPT